MLTIRGRRGESWLAVRSVRLTKEQLRRKKPDDCKPETTLYLVRRLCCSNHYQHTYKRFKTFHLRRSEISSICFRIKKRRRHKPWAEPRRQQSTGRHRGPSSRRLACVFGREARRLVSKSVFAATAVRPTVPNRTPGPSPTDNTCVDNSVAVVVQHSEHRQDQ